MSDLFITPLKSASTPFDPRGVWIGVVEAVVGSLLTISVPRLSGDELYEGVEYVASGFDSPPVVGEKIVVSFHEGRQDELIALGRLKSGTSAQGTALTVTLTGDVTGSGSLAPGGDGSNVITIATTNSLNSIALGADTTGNYVATITGTADQVIVSGSGTETAAVTLALPQSIASSSSPTFAGMTINGNLTVNGTTTTINSTTVTVDDIVLTLGGDTAPTADDNKDRGIGFRWHNGTVAKLGFFGFKDSTGKFTFIPDATNTSDVFSGVTGELDAKVDWANILNKPNLDALTDVTIAAPTNDRVLQYSGATSEWVVGKRLTVSSAQPSLPQEGDVWFDMSTNVVTSSVARVYIQSTAPSTSETTYLWIQTYGGGRYTFWIEDGT